MRLRGLEAKGTAATPQHGARSGEYTAGVLPHSHLSHGHDVSAGNRKSALQTLTDASRNVEMRAQRSALPGMFLWEACSTRLEKKLQCTVRQWAHKQRHAALTARRHTWQAQSPTLTTAAQGTAQARLLG